MAHLTGIEPAHSAPEADALSTELQAHETNDEYCTIKRKKNQCKNKIKGWILKDKIRQEDTLRN